MADQGGEYNPSSLSTPSRDSDPNNANGQQYAKKNQNNPNNANNRQNDTSNTGNQANTDGGAGGTGAAPEGGVPTNNKNGVASGSCLAGPENPKTVTRKNLSVTGNDVIVHFDERVVVHTVPYWDPCGETYYDDDENEQRNGPNCCTIL